MAETQHNIGIRIGGDASGAVDASKQAADAQKHLGEQFAKTGDQAKKNAEESRRFVERLKEEAETFGKTRSEIERYRAGQLQLTDAQKKSAEASIAQVEALNRKAQAIAFVRNMALLAAAALGTYVAATVIGARGAIDQAASLHTLSQTYGISTQALSGYRYQMGLAGVSQEDFNSSIKTLAKNIGEARGGVGDGAALFRLLGRDIESAVRSGVSIEELVPRLADKFQQFADGPNKAALAYRLLGGAAERVLPELSKGSAGIKEAAAEAEKLGLIIGPGFASQSDRFNSNLARTNALFTAGKIAIANEYLPALNTFIERFMVAAKLSGGGILSGADLMMKAKLLETYETQRSKLPESERPDLDAAIAKLREDPRLGKYRAQTDPWQMAFDEQEARARALQAGMGTQEAPGLPKTGQGPTDFQRLMTQANEMIALADLELASTEKLTEADRMRVQMYQAVAAGMLQLEPRQQLQIQAALELAQIKQRELLDRQRDIELGKAAAQSLDALLKADEARGAALAAFNQENNEKVQQLELETKLLASATEQERSAVAVSRDWRKRIEDEASAAARLNAEREKAIEFRRIDLQAQKAMIDAAPEEIAVLYRLAEAQKATIGEAIDRRAAAQRDRDVVKATARHLQEESDRIADNLERSLTDATVSGLRDGFRRGESVVQNFLHRLEEMFFSAVLTPIIQPIVRPVAQFVGGAVSGLISGIGGSLFPSAANAASGAFGFNPLGFGGAQTLADFGNFFGSVGAVTETGATFGLMNAITGFAAANPITAIGAAVAGTGLLSSLFGGGDDAPAGVVYPPLTAYWDQDPNSPLRSRYGTPGGVVVGGYPPGGGTEEAMRLLNDPTQYDPEVLRQLLGGGGMREIGGTVADFLKQMEPAHQAIVAFSASMQQARDAIRAAQDPTGFWAEQVARAGAELGSSATTVEEWRNEFSRALDGALTKEQFAKWQQFGQVLEQAARAGGRFTETVAAVSQSAQSSAQLSSRLAEQSRRMAEDYRRAAVDLGSTAQALQLSDLSPLTMGQRLNLSRSALDAAYARALGGDLEALSGLPDSARAFLEASRGYNASSPAYTADFGRVLEMLGQAGGRATDLGTAQDQQATLLELQRETLNGILEQLRKPSPDTAILVDSRAMLATISGQLGAIDTGSGQTLTLLAAYLERAIPGHAEGLPVVTADNYLMRAHRGEAVIDAPTMQAFRRYGIEPRTDDGSSAEMRRELAELRACVQRLERAFAALPAAVRDAVRDAAREQTRALVLAGEDNARAIARANIGVIEASARA